MAAVPQNDEEFVQRMNAFIQWIVAADREVRLEIGKAIVKAFPLEDVTTMGNAVSRIKRRKQRRLAQGHNADPVPFFVNVPNMGIVLVEDEEMHVFQVGDFGVVGVGQAGPNMGGAIEGVVLLAPVDELPPPPENLDNVNVNRNFSIWDHVRNFINAVLSFLRIPRIANHGN